MPVRVLEVARVATVERFLRRLHDDPTRRSGLSDDVVDFRSGLRVVGQREGGRCRRLLG